MKFVLDLLSVFFPGLAGDDDSDEEAAVERRPAFDAIQGLTIRASKASGRCYCLLHALYVPSHRRSAQWRK